MKSAFAVHKESQKKPVQGFKIRLKPPGKVTKAKKKTAKKTAQKTVQTKKKAENRIQSSAKESTATASKSTPASPKSKPASPKSKSASPKLRTVSPRSKPNKEAVAASPTRKDNTKAKDSTEGGKPTPEKPVSNSPKRRSEISIRSPQSSKKLNQKLKQSKEASSVSPVKKGTRKTKETPDKSVVSSPKRKSGDAAPTPETSGKPASKISKDRKAPSKQISKKRQSVQKPKEKSTKTSGPSKTSPQRQTGKQPSKSPLRKSPTKSPKESPVRKLKAKTATKAKKKSDGKNASPLKSPAVSRKGPSKSPQKRTAKGESSPEKDGSLALTPGTEQRATKEASKDAMLVKLTPLKSNGAQRKRKSTPPTSNSKSLKKLKIKIPSRKSQNLTTPSPARVPADFPQRQQSPRIVNSSSPQNGLLSKNGPSVVHDSVKESALLFEWLISPVNPSNFFENLWEKKPLLVRRHKPDYYQGLFSTGEFNSILKENDVQFSKHLDVTTYTEGKRETHNPEGRAHAPVVWDYFNSGCSVRLLNPQTYSTKVWKMLATLKEHFGSFCGANIYLTPAGTQGFAPHYDDIEAFVLQLEGRKQWKLYSPRNDNEVLPRLSSGNFTEADLGAPILDTVLEEGDVLYFPRGYIHQATPPSDTHSLHLTLSTCQKNTWGDLMTKLIQETLHSAMEEDLEFRLSLPRDYLNFMGVVNCDVIDEKRAEFRAKIRDLFKKMASYAPLDAAVDQMGKDLLHASLPPVLTDEEKSCMIYSTKVRFEDGGFVSDSGDLTKETEIQLIRKGVLRLVTEEEEIRVYHCVENSRLYHGKPAQYFVIPSQSAPGVEFLYRQYPNYVQIQDLPLEGELQGKGVELASLLYEKGLIRTRYPLNVERTSDG